MSKPQYLIAAILTLSLHAVTTVAQEDAAAARFAAVTAELDRGGDFYMYWDGRAVVDMLRPRLEALRDIIVTDATIQGPANEAETRRGIRVLQTLLEQAGLPAVQALGMSSKTVADGRYRHRTVVYHASAANDCRLGQVLFPAPAHALPDRALLPPDTAAALMGDCDLSLLWRWFAETIRLAGSPADVRKFDQGLADAKAQGLDITKLLASTQSPAGFAFTLDRRRTVELPVDNETITVPAPAWMLFCAAKDKTVLDTAKAIFDHNEVPYITADFPGGGEGYILQIPALQAAPFTFRPTLVYHDNYLFLGTTARIVSDALECRLGDKDGLATSPEYARLTAHLPEDGNHFAYVSPRLTRVGADLLKRGIAKDNGPEKGKQIMQVLGLVDAPADGALVTQRQAGSWVVTANTNIMTSRAVFAAVASAPVALTLMISEDAAKTKQKKTALAQRRENKRRLQQIGLALMLYCGDHDGAFPPDDGVAGLQALVESGLLTGSRAYVHPGDSQRQAPPTTLKKLTHDKLSYTYLGGGFKDDDELAAITPVCFDKPGVAQGVTVLFLDGHVQWYPGNYRTRADVVRMLRKAASLPDLRYAKLRRKARRLDERAADRQ